jgi:predicted MFS family arabinose efflux permease
MRQSRYRWFVVSTFLVFILLHQADKLLIGPLTTPIMETFGIDEAQMGLVFSGAILVGAICYPLWGLLFDLFRRTRLLALASLIWGSTTWLSAIARSFPFFLATRASTGIDDSCYPGIYNTVADYFEPRKRGRVNGILGLGQPAGYLLGMAIAIFLGASLGWRNVFFITGGVGVVLSAVIFFLVREPARGGSEPEIAASEHKVEFRFSWKTAFGLLKKRSLILLFFNGFFGVFPWQVITFWFFRFLEKERGYASGRMFIFMVVVVLVLAAGYPLGGALGDLLFKRTKRGRLVVSCTGILIGAVLLAAAITRPLSQPIAFEVLVGLAALFMPLAAANAIATIYDVTEPEVRSTANSMLSFMEQIGSATAPAIAGFIAVRASLGTAILGICTSAWAVCFVFMVLAAIFVPRDIVTLRGELKARAS